MNPLKVAVLASGTGTNLTSILAATEDGTLSAEIVLVISNRENAGALEVARKHGVPALHLALEQFESQEELDQAFLNAFEKNGVNFIAAQVGKLTHRLADHRLGTGVGGIIAGVGNSHQLVSQAQGVR